MILPRFKYHEPESLDEACEILGDLKDKAKPLAGGTDLIVNMKKRIVSPESLVSIERIEELRGIDKSDGELRIGACVNICDIVESGDIKNGFSALSIASNNLGTPLIRNLATVGGNIVSARPAADLPPPLMAYEAKIRLKKKEEERVIPLHEFFKGPGITLIEPDELLVDIIIEPLPERYGSSYIKLGLRKALEISIVNIAVFLALNGDDTISSARIVMGAVGPVPLRSSSAEKSLMGERPSDKLFEEAGRLASQESRPIDDFRGSAEYRRDMVHVLTKRALKQAMEDIKSK